MSTNTFINLLLQSKPMLYMLFLSYFEPLVIFLCLIRFSWSWGLGTSRGKTSMGTSPLRPVAQTCCNFTTLRGGQLTLESLSWTSPYQSFWSKQGQGLFFFFYEKFLIPFLLHLISDENPAFSDSRANSSLGFYNGLCFVVYWVRNIFVVCTAPTLPVSVSPARGNLGDKTQIAVCLFCSFFPSPGRPPFGLTLS